MKNLFYNIGLFLFTLVQTYVAYLAIAMTTMIDDNNMPVVIIMWVVLVGLAFLDKLIRGIKGWPQVLLCLLVSPLRGVIQFIVLIITIVNLFRRANPVCERGMYYEDSFVGTLAYITLGIMVETENERAKRIARSAEREEKRKRDSARKSQRREARRALLAKYPDYFQLEDMLDKIPIKTGSLSTSDAGITDEEWDITYNDSYTEMQIVYCAKVYPKDDYKMVQKAWKHYASECQALRKRAESFAVSELQDYMAKWPFRGSVEWSIRVSIDDVKFRIN